MVTHTKSPWPRRALTFPLVTLAASLGTALAPVLLVPALFHDLARFALSRRPFVLVRLVAFALFYAWAEVVGLAMLGLVWLASLPSRERHATLVARTYVVQRHWAHALLVFARRLLALCFEVAGEAHVSPGPVIVLVNHASLLDTLLPTIFVTHTHGLALRFVLKEELLVSPCLDVAGLRLPNVFVDRSSAQTARELERIRALSSGLGRRRDPLPRAHAHDAQEARASAREARDGRPSLHAEALKLTHVLPPRFGGTSALLDGAPEADVLLLAHRGLEGIAHFGGFLAGSLAGTTILRFWRIPRGEIPADREGRARWLLREWPRVDASVGSRGADDR